MLDRKNAPPFVKTNSLQLPESREIVLPTGLKIHLIEGVQQDVVKLEVVFAAGKWFETKTGLSHFTAQMLEKGTEKRSSFQISEVLDQFGAHLEISPGFDFVSVSLYSLKQKLKFLLPVFMDVITAPSFPEKEWKQAQDIAIQNLKINEEKTGYLASKYIRQNIFGDTHPYGPSPEASDIKQITTTHLSGYFKARFGASKIYIVGQLVDKDIETLVKELSQLRSQMNTAAELYSIASGPSHQHIEKKNSVQSSIRLGRKTLLKGKSDYFDIQIVNHLLGGFFGSRLMKNIREEKGLTYGIYSSISAFQQESLLTIGADVDRRNLTPAIQEIKSELKKLRSEEVTTQELTLAKNHFIGSLQSDMANPFAVAEKIKNIHLFSLTGDFYQRLIDKVDKITPSRVQEVAELHFHEKVFFEVTVG